MRAKERTTIGWLLLLLCVPFWASCSDDSKSSVSSNDYCYIKSVTLGMVKRQLGTTTATFSASSYEMTVDHRSLTIENRDSLPCGSNLSRVIATITFDGSTLSYREKGSEAGWTAYNSTDSLNLTRPIELYLASNDNTSHRIYTLKVNVHRQEGDSLFWKKCEEEELLAGMEEMKVFTHDGKLLVLGKKDADIVLLQRSSTEAQGTWIETTAAGLPATTDVQTLRQQAGTCYVSTADGDIFASADAREWQQTGTRHTAPLTLIEKTDDWFYAISEGRLLRSADAESWEDDRLDAEATLLPAYGISTLTVEQANGNHRIILVGQSDGTGHTIVWNKMWNDSEPEAESQWTYFPLSPDNTSPCPQIAHLNLLTYDGKCIALGGASADGKHQALDAMYVSQDYGITWRPDTQHPLPSALKGTGGSITSTVDKDNFIWIITNKQVWRGRLNRLGFAQQ